MTDTVLPAVATVVDLGDANDLTPVTIDLSADDGATPAVVKPTEDVSAGLEQLRQQLADTTRRETEARQHADSERRRADEEARRRAEVERQTVDLRKNASQAEYDAISAGLTNSKAELDRITNDMTRHYEAGEFSEVAKLQARMATIGGQIAQMESGLRVADEARQAPTPPPAAAPQVQQQDDYGRREQFLQQQSPATADWLRRNDRFFNDLSFQAKVVKAADYAVGGKGLIKDTPEFFRYIENEVGLQTPAAPVLQQQQQRHAPIAAAPSSGGSVPAPIRGTAQVQLSKEERELARHIFADSKDPDRDYAREKLALAESGWRPRGV